MPKTALLINTGSGKNIGDRAMLLNNALSLHRYGIDKIYLPVDFPPFLSEELAATPYTPLYSCTGRFKALRLLPNQVKNKLDILMNLFFVCALVSIAKIGKIPTTWKFGEADLIRAIQNSDIIIMSGGGYLTDKGILECRSCLLMGIIALHFRKPLFLTGQGIGPIWTRITQRLLKVVAKGSKMVFVRDPCASKQALIQLGIKEEKIFLAGDDAISLPSSRDLFLKFRSDEKIIGIQWRVSPFTPDPTLLSCLLKDILIKAIESGWKVRFFIFADQKTWEYDIYEDVTRGLENEKFEIVADADPRKLRHAIGQCRVAVGIAYHFNVFALAEGVPCLGLYGGDYYQQKIEGLFSLFSRKEWTLKYSNANATEILQKINILDKNRKEYSTLLKIKYRLLATERENNFNYFLSDKFYFKSSQT